MVRKQPPAPAYGQKSRSASRRVLPAGRDQFRPGGREARRRAVFFDRDGTLNEEIGHLNHPSHLRIYPFAARAVQLVNQAGLLAIVVTNQSGVGQGLFEEVSLDKVHRRLARGIRAAGGRLDGIFYCPHHPQAALKNYRRECRCRKPSPGMLERAAAEFGIDLEKSFVVGDRHLDIQMGHQVGARGVLVLTGFGQDEWEYQRAGWQQQPDHVAADVYEAVCWILQHL